MDIAGSLTLAVLFGSAYLLARAWMVSDAGSFAIAALARRAGKASGRVLLGFTLAVAGLSLIIPNFVAAMAASPFVARIVAGFRPVGGQSRDLTTAFAAACMWAANVGGKGSIVGSPANALLIVYLQAASVPGRQDINYLSWFAFGIPLAIVLALTVWAVLRLAFARPLGLAEPSGAGLEAGPLSRGGARIYRLTLGFLAFWLLTGAAQGLFGADAAWPVAAAALLFGAVLAVQMFAARGGGPALIRPGDMTGGIPWRGLAVVIVTGGISFALLKLFSVDARAAELARWLSAAGMSGFALLFAILLLVIFATELASNTVVALTFFPVAHAIAPVIGMEPLPFLILVSLASTAGYMTPMATPANALVAGEVRDIAFARLVSLGLVLDIAVALLLAFWGVAVMPLVL